LEDGTRKRRRDGGSVAVPMEATIPLTLCASHTKRDLSVSLRSSETGVASSQWIDAFDSSMDRISALSSKDHNNNATMMRLKSILTTTQRADLASQNPNPEKQIFKKFELVILPCSENSTSFGWFLLYVCSLTASMRILWWCLMMFDDFHTTQNWLTTLHKERNEADIRWNIGDKEEEEEEEDDDDADL